MAKLTIVNVNFGKMSFSDHCFNTLVDLIQASTELESLVMETIEKEIITKLNDKTSDEIPISLLKGITRLIKKSGKCHMLKSCFGDNNFFAKSLAAI